MLFPNALTKNIDGKDVPLFLIGDSAYPLTTWLMKPFPHNASLSDDMRHYNYRLSRARIVVENTFGRLKARWHRLLKRLDMDVPVVITACCILNNMCEIHGDSFKESWMEGVSDDSGFDDQPTNDDENEAGYGGPKEIRSTHSISY